MPALLRLLLLISATGNIGHCHVVVVLSIKKSIRNDRSRLTALNVKLATRGNAAIRSLQITKCHRQNGAYLEGSSYRKNDAMERTLKLPLAIGSGHSHGKYIGVSAIFKYWEFCSPVM